MVTNGKLQLTHRLVNTFLAMRPPLHKIATEPPSSCWFLRLLLVWDLNLGIATGRGCVYGRGNFADVLSNARPLRSAEHDQSYSASRQALLVPHVLVGGKENIKASALGFG